MILVCLKWVSLRPEIDPLTGEVETDARWSGVSTADQAALELGLEFATTRGTTVLALTVGGPESEPALHDALAVGATSAVRIDTPTGMASEAVAEHLAQYIHSLGPHTIDLILCGDWSADRGSGSVPVYLAEALGLDDACGLVSVTAESPEVLRVERRLDGGRREKLRISVPAVVSVEGVAARLRRASLQGILRAKTQPVEVWRPRQPVISHTSDPIRTGPYRPPARVLDGPDTSLPPLRRVEILTGAFNERTPPRALVLEPEAAADAILEQLASWGYVLPSHNET